MCARASEACILFLPSGKYNRGRIDPHLAPPRFPRQVVPSSSAPRTTAEIDSMLLLFFPLAIGGPLQFPPQTFGLDLDNFSCGEEAIISSDYQETIKVQVCYGFIGIIAST